MQWIRLADMKPLTIPDKEEMILALQDEIRRSEQARYDHRLHGVLLVAEGLTCPEVANLLGDAHMEVVESALRQPPAAAGLPGGIWDGKMLSAFLDQRFGVKLKVRQCQRLFRQLGFRLRKPRPLIAHADAQAQSAYKKTPQVGQGPKH